MCIVPILWPCLLQGGGWGLRIWRQVYASGAKTSKQSPQNLQTSNAAVIYVTGWWALAACICGQEMLCFPPSPLERKSTGFCVLRSWGTKRLKWLTWKEVSGKARSQLQLFQRSDWNQTAKTSPLLNLSSSVTNLKKIQTWESWSGRRQPVLHTPGTREKQKSQAVVSLCLRVHACFCVPLQEERVNSSN